MMAKIRIENVVASIALADTLALPTFALGLQGAEYSPDQFPGVTYRHKEPKTAILLFHSGRLVWTDAKRMREVETSIATVAQQIKKRGEPTHVHRGTRRRTSSRPRTWALRSTSARSPSHRGSTAWSMSRSSSRASFSGWTNRRSWS
jgi:hypothetical protein